MNEDTAYVTVDGQCTVNHDINVALNSCGFSFFLMTLGKVE